MSQATDLVAIATSAGITGGGVIFDSGSYLPVTNWGTGIPVSSIKQVHTAQYIRINDKVTVWGSAYFKNDGGSPLDFLWSVPITNGNNIVTVNGSMGRMNAVGESAGTVSRVNALAALSAQTTNIRFNNTGINTTGTDAFWTYSFTYTLA